jgi:hypothetical protein
MTRHNRLFYFRESTEPHGFIKALALLVFIDPVGNGAGQVSSDREEADAKSFSGVGASRAKFAETNVEPNVQ